MSTRKRGWLGFVGFVAWLVVVSGLSIGMLPSGWVPAADAFACDADGDGTAGGSTSVELLDGTESVAITAGLGSPGAGYRWRATVCYEFNGSSVDERVIGSATRVEAPEAAYWQVNALGEALDEIRAETRAPVLQMWPEPDGTQIVRLETWLAIDPVPSAWRTIVESATFGEVTVTARAVPDSVVWEFSDEIVRCDSPGVEYTPGAAGPAPCGKDWDHTTDVVPQQLRVWVEYSVTWTSSLGQSGSLWSLLDGADQGPGPLTVGEVQAVGIWGDQNRPDDPGITEADLGDSPNCSLSNYAQGNCFDPPEDSCHLTWKLWKTTSCVGEVVDLVVDIGEWVVDQGWELFYKSLPAPVRRAVDEILSFLAGCAEYGIEALSGIKDMIMQALSAATNPVAYLQEQLALAKEIYGAIQEDAEAFAKQFFGDLIEYDLLQENPAKWAGKVGCEIAVGLLTAGGAAAAGRFARVFDKIDEFTDAIREWRRKRRNGEDTDSDSDSPWLCNNSFPTGTLVLVRDNIYRPIELIKPGDQVLGYDTTTGRWQTQTVLDQWSATHHGAMATATVDGGVGITSTDDHLFWVDDQGQWIEADELQPGDHLLGPDGVTRVDAVALSASSQTLVWELDTTPNDNFIVATEPGTDAVVHNAGKCYDAPEPPDGYSGRSFDDLLPDGTVPGQDGFADWWDDLSMEELEYLSQNSDLFSTMKTRIRGSGGQHEWCMCSQMTKAKEWDLSMDQVQAFTNDTADVRGFVPDDIIEAYPDRFPDYEPGDVVEWQHPTAGHPNDSGANLFHQELSDLIGSSSSSTDFLDGLPDLLDRWGIPEDLVTIPTDWD